MITHKKKVKVPVDLIEVCQRIAVLETKMNALLWLFGAGTTLLGAIFLKLYVHF
jgi:hypothetical protein